MNVQLFWKSASRATACLLAPIAMTVSAQQEPLAADAAIDTTADTLEQPGPAQADSETAIEATPAGETESETPVAESEPVIEEIFVTAQRKSERLQDVPIAVNVLSSESLESMGMLNTRDLEAAVPGLEFKSSGAGGTPFLRGVGANAANPNDEPSVATYIDGVYIAAPFANVMSLANIERVEVLKGPQGTLFGRNATGGVIQIVTRDPKQEPAVELRAGTANYRTNSGSIYATTGITDNLAVDLSAQAEQQDKGWGRNLTRDQEIYEGKNYSVRSKTLFTPTDLLSFRLSLDHAESNSTMFEYRLPKGVVGIDGQVSPGGKYDTASNITLDGIGASRVISRQSGAALRADYQFEALQLVSLSSYRDARGVYKAEADGTPDIWVEANLPLAQKNLSQEFQLISNNEGWLDWVAGAYLYRSEASYLDGVFNGLAFSSPAGTSVQQFQFDGEQKTRSYSVYAQGTAEIVESTRLTAGLRYTDEHQELTQAAFDTPLPKKPDRGFEKLTWRLALDRAFTNDVHSYLSYNRGVKGGGFDLIPGPNPGFNPEVLDAYELGLKTQLLDRKLRFNVAAFYYDYQDIQVQVIPTGEGGGAAARTTNAAKAAIKGLDVDFQYVPITNLTFSGGFVILDGEYKDFKNTVSYPDSPLSGPSEVIDASGNDTLQTPKFAGSLTTEYRVQSSLGEFPLSVMLSHNDGYFFGADNRLKQDPFTLINASAGWNALDGRYGVSVWGRNLGGEYYYAQGIPSGLGSLITPAAPRTFGVSLKANF